MDYAPPPVQDLPPSSTSAAPAVVVWFKVYSGLMALLYLIVMVAGVVFLSMDPQDFDPSATAEDAMVMKIVAWVYIVLGLVFLLPFAYGAFMGNASWCWVFGMVLICISLTSGCCMVAGIPLMIFWLKPETKRYFGRPV